MKRPRRRQELLMSAAITVLLLIFAGLASFCVTTRGLAFLDWQMGQVSFTAGGFLGFISCTDYPTIIRSSRFLRSLTTAFAFMLFLIGLGPQFLRFLPQTRSYEHWSALFILAAILLFAASSVLGLIYQYVTTRSSADS